MTPFEPKRVLGVRSYKTLCSNGYLSKLSDSSFYYTIC